MGRQMPHARRGQIMRAPRTGAHGASHHAHVRGQGDRAPENPCGQHQCCRHNSRIHIEPNVCFSTVASSERSAQNQRIKFPLYSLPAPGNESAHAGSSPHHRRGSGRRLPRETPPPHFNARDANAVPMISCGPEHGDGAHPAGAIIACLPALSRDRAGFLPGRKRPGDMRMPEGQMWQEGTPMTREGRFAPKANPPLNSASAREPPVPWPCGAPRARVKKPRNTPYYP